MTYPNKVVSHWLVYWKDAKNGVPPLGLVATLRTEQEAIDYICHVFSPEDRKKLAYTTVSHRTKR